MEAEEPAVLTAEQKAVLENIVADLGRQIPKFGYERGDRCFDALHEMRRGLRDDDPTARDIFVHLSEWDVVKGHICPLIMSLRREDAEQRQYFAEALTIIALLTKQVELDAPSRQHHIELAQKHKMAFLNHQYLECLIGYLVGPAQRYVDSTQTDEDFPMIDSILTVLRNLCAVPDSPAAGAGSIAGAQRAYLHMAFLNSMERAGVFELLMSLSQNSVGVGFFKPFSLSLLEIWHFVFRGLPIREVVDYHFVLKSSGGPQSSGRDILESTVTAELLQALKRERDRERVSRSGRNRSFRGVLVRRNTATGERKVALSLESSQASMSWKEAAPHIHRNVVGRKRATAVERLSGHMFGVRAADREALYQLVSRFLDVAFNDVVGSAFTAITRDGSDVKPGDSVRLMSLVGTVVQFWRFREEKRLGETVREDERSAAADEAADGADSALRVAAGEVALVAHANFFKGIFNFQKQFRENKDLSGVEFSAMVLYELTQVIHMLYASKSVEDRDMAATFLSKLLYVQDENSIITGLYTLIRLFKPAQQSQRLLELLALTADCLLNMLDESSKRDGGLFIRKKRRRKVKEEDKGIDALRGDISDSGADEAGEVFGFDQALHGLQEGEGFVESGPVMGSFDIGAGEPEPPLRPREGSAAEEGKAGTEPVAVDDREGRAGDQGSDSGAAAIASTGPSAEGASAAVAADHTDRVAEPAEALGAAGGDALKSETPVAPVADAKSSVAPGASEDDAAVLKAVSQALEDLREEQAPAGTGGKAGGRASDGDAEAGAVEATGPLGSVATQELDAVRWTEDVAADNGAAADGPASGGAAVDPADSTDGGLELAADAGIDLAADDSDAGKKPSAPVEVGGWEYYDTEDQIEFQSILDRFATKECLQSYAFLLDHYADNPGDVNRCVARYFTRLMDECKVAPLLFQLSVFFTLNKVLNDPGAVLADGIAELREVSARVVAEFLKAAQARPLLYAECLFWKESLDVDYILDDDKYLEKHGGAWETHAVHFSEPEDEDSDAEIDFAALNVGHPWHEEDDMKLREECAKRKGQKGLIEQLAEAMEGRTRKDLRERLVELGLRKAPTKSLPWSEEDDAALREAWDSNKHDPDALQILARTLSDGKRSARAIRQRLRKIGVAVPSSMKTHGVNRPPAKKGRHKNAQAEHVPERKQRIVGDLFNRFAESGAYDIVGEICASLNYADTRPDVEMLLVLAGLEVPVHGATPSERYDGPSPDDPVNSEPEINLSASGSEGSDDVGNWDTDDSTFDPKRPRARPKETRSARGGSGASTRRRHLSPALSEEENPYAAQDEESSGRGRGPATRSGESAEESAAETDSSSASDGGDAAADTPESRRAHAMAALVRRTRRQRIQRKRRKIFNIDTVGEEAATPAGAAEPADAVPESEPAGGGESAETNAYGAVGAKAEEAGELAGEVAPGRKRRRLRRMRVPRNAVDERPSPSPSPSPRERVSPPADASGAESMQEEVVLKEDGGAQDIAPRKRRRPAAPLGDDDSDSV